MKSPYLVLLVGAVLIFVVACGGSAGNDATPTPSPIPTSELGVTPGPGVTDAEIVIGMTNDLTGEGGTPYAAVTTAVQAYFAAVNDEMEGVCGREIVLATADDRYTPEIALEETKGLVEDKEVLAIIGAQSTEAHRPVAEYLNDPNEDGRTNDGVPDLFVSTGWSGWGDVRELPWTIGFIPDYESDGQVIASYVRENMPEQTVGLVHEDSAFGEDYRAVLEAALDPDILVAVAAYPQPEPDDAGSVEVAPLVDSMANEGADVVVLATTPEVSAAVYKAADDKGFSPQFILSYVNAPSMLAAAIGGGTSADNLLEGFEALAGTVTFEYTLNLVEDEGAPALIEHKRIMETFDGPPVTTLSTYGQALAETVVETLERACNRLTREGVIEAAESLAGFAPSLLLPDITVELSESDHRAIESLQPVVIEDDGSLTRIGDPISAEG